MVIYKQSKHTSKREKNVLKKRWKFWLFKRNSEQDKKNVIFSKNTFLTVRNYYGLTSRKPASF